MPYGDPLSTIRETTGIAAELPLSRYRYIDFQGDPSQKTASDYSIGSLALKSGERAKAEPIRVEYTRYTGSFSFGMDPMVSKASVIHELAYGRITSGVSQTGGVDEYPVLRENVPHGIDLVV